MKVLLFLLLFASASIFRDSQTQPPDKVDFSTHNPIAPHAITTPWNIRS